jgi:hypothetical protein
LKREWLLEDTGTDRSTKMGVNEIGSEKLDWVDLQFIDKLGYTD